MKRRALFFTGTLMFVAAWFLPVVKEGTTLSSGTLPGWQAFRVSLDPLWPYDNPSASGDPFYFKVLGVVSGLSNVVFVGALVTVGLSARSRALWKVLLACALINTFWFVLSSDRNGFRMGYYLWVGSYFVLAAGLRLRGRSGQEKNRSAAV